MSSDRNRLQSLVDALPDAEVQVAISFLAELGEREIIDAETAAMLDLARAEPGEDAPPGRSPAPARGAVRRASLWTRPFFIGILHTPPNRTSTHEYERRARATRALTPFIVQCKEKSKARPSRATLCWSMHESHPQ